MKSNTFYYEFWTEASSFYSYTLIPPTSYLHYKSIWKNIEIILKK